MRRFKSLSLINWTQGKSRKIAEWPLPSQDCYSDPCFFCTNVANWNWGHPHHLFTESQNGRDWKGPLWNILSKTPAKAGSPRQQAAQDLIQAGFECLQRRRIHNFSGQPVPVLRHSQTSCSDGSSYASVCAHFPLSCHWASLKRVWPHPLNAHPSDIYRHLYGPISG